MPFDEDLAEKYWEEFSSRTGISDQISKNIFIEIISKVVHGSEFVKICHAEIRMVSRQMGTRAIPKLINKELVKDIGKKKAFIKIFEYLGSCEDSELIYSKKVLKQLEWGMTYGDFLLKVLDFFVCKGVLSKSRFRIGRPGHRFRKNEHEIPCPYGHIIYDEYGMPKHFECLFNWTDGVLIKGRTK